MSNPILVELTRGTRIESVHRGSVCLAGSAAPPLLAIGDIESPVYPRSAIKLLQALPLVESGAADRFQFGAAELALACGSHVGSERHVAVARGMLTRIGLSEEALGCGPAEPLGAKAAKALARSGAEPTALHHNCSGKHAGMLATALQIGAPVAGYCARDHAVQDRVHATLSGLTGLPLGADVCGTDGCSVPNWAMPLKSMARLFARLGSGEGLTSDRKATIDRILAACWAEPELVAGPGRVDTIVMARFPGQIFLKTGAEGVYCGAVPALGLGFAIKVDDGATRASAGAVMALVERLVPAARGLVHRGTLRTAGGLEIGCIRCSAGYQRALDALRI